MKVFFISTRQPYQTYRECPHVSSMKALGINVYPFEYYLRFPKLNTLQINRALYKEVLEFKPDVILMFKSPHINHNVLRMLKKKLKDTVLVYWYGDIRDTVFGEIEERKDIIDILLVQQDKEEAGGFYYSRGIEIPMIESWYIGVDPSVHKYYKPEEKCDLIFCGNNFTLETSRNPK